jgi:hypothetical protein
MALVGMTVGNGRAAYGTAWGQLMVALGDRPRYSRGLALGAPVRCGLSASKALCLAR